MRQENCKVGKFTYYWNPNDKYAVMHGEFGFLTITVGPVESPYMAFYTNGTSRLLFEHREYALTEQDRADLENIRRMVWKG